jgi:hypothetical protein
MTAPNESTQSKCKLFLWLAQERMRAFERRKREFRKRSKAGDAEPQIRDQIQLKMIAGLRSPLDTLPANSYDLESL